MIRVLNLEVKKIILRKSTVGGDNKVTKMTIAHGFKWVTQKSRDFRRKTWGPNQLKKLPKRAILKNGDANVLRTKLSKYGKWRFLQDIVTTLLDAQWRWTLQFIATCFFGCWLFFALIWWLIAFVHGDLQDDHLPTMQAESGWTPCVLNIHGFHSCFLYSLETQHTTGYGLRVITEECPEAIFILCFQCIIGCMIDSFTVGMVFAKMIRSKHARNTIQFSKFAVICRRDEKICLMFRVGDIRRSKIVGVGVRGILIRNYKTDEGDIIRNYQTELSLKADDEDDNLVLLWPVTVYHVIDKESPLHGLSTREMLKQKLEIVVILSATVESTGVSTEARSSYLASEILWNRRFEPMISFNKILECHQVDWLKFDKIILETSVLDDHEDERTIFEVPKGSELPINYPSTSMANINGSQSPPTPQFYDQSSSFEVFEEEEPFINNYNRPEPPIPNPRNRRPQYLPFKKRGFPETIQEEETSLRDNNNHEEVEMAII